MSISSCSRGTSRGAGQASDGSVKSLWRGPPLRLDSLFRRTSEAAKQDKPKHRQRSTEREEGRGSDGGERAACNNDERSGRGTQVMSCHHCPTSRLHLLVASLEIRQSASCGQTELPERKCEAANRAMATAGGHGIQMLATMPPHKASTSSRTTTGQTADLKIWVPIHPRHMLRSAASSEPRLQALVSECFPASSTRAARLDVIVLASIILRSPPFGPVDIRTARCPPCPNPSCRANASA